MTVYHSIVCTDDACDPGVDGGPACPYYRAADEERERALAAQVTSLREAAARAFAYDAGDPKAALVRFQKACDEAPRKAEKWWARRQRQIPTAVRRDVLSSGTCAYCGDFATDVDHIVPVAQGGTRARENLAPACSSCNWDKLDFTPEQWREYREHRGKPWPPVSRTSLISDLAATAAAEFMADGTLEGL